MKTTKLYISYVLSPDVVSWVHLRRFFVSHAQSPPHNVTLFCRTNTCYAAMSVPVSPCSGHDDDDERIMRRRLAPYGCCCCCRRPMTTMMKENNEEKAVPVSSCSGHDDDDER